MSKKHNITPILTYFNVENEKSKIYTDNRNKCGIYRWINKTNNKDYIGSSINLSRRFSTYFSLTTINKIIEKESSIVLKAIVKHGISNFNLEILEYCNKDLVVKREQYYIDNMYPKYNILKLANSRFGYKLKFKTKKAMSISSRNNKRLYKTSKQVFVNKQIASKIINNNTKERLSLRSQGVNVKIFDLFGNFIEKFTSFRSAANYLNINVATIKSVFDRGVSYDNYIYEFEPKDLRVWIYNKDYKLIDVLKNAKTTSSKYNIPCSTLSDYIKSGKLYNNELYFHKYVK